MKNLQTEHDAQNEAYVTAKAALFAGGAKPEKKMEALSALADERIEKLMAALAGITDFSGQYVETLDLFVSFFDDVVLECTELASRRAELEEKILSLCAKVLEKPTADSARDAENEHVTAIIIDCLGEKPTGKVAKEMAEAVVHETNPLRLGLEAYKNFCQKNPLIADVTILEYLKTENDVRAGLIKGDDSATFAALEKLLASPIDCSEKYLLTSLNSYYHGFEQDAARALQIGLGRFPGNKRLLSAVSAIGG